MIDHRLLLEAIEIGGLLLVLALFCVLLWRVGRARDDLGSLHKALAGLHVMLEQATPIVMARAIQAIQDNLSQVSGRVTRLEEDGLEQRHRAVEARSALMREWDALRQALQAQTSEIAQQVAVEVRLTLAGEITRLVRTEIYRAKETPEERT